MAPYIEMPMHGSKPIVESSIDQDKSDKIARTEKKMKNASFLSKKESWLSRVHDDPHEDSKKSHG